VLLPVRNGEDHLREAIVSLQAQTDPDYEVLAVDDGSTDGTRDLLAEWARDDDRVKILDQPPLGIVTALERARARARGTYLARMDADDVCDPSRFGRQRALLEDTPGLAGCGAQVRYVPRKGLRGGARRYEAWLNSSATPGQVALQMFVECPLAHPTFFLRSGEVARVGGYRDMGWPEDYDLVLRLWGAGAGLANVPEVLLHWRERPDRLSRTHGAYAPGAFVACKVHHLRKTLLAGRSVAVWGAGPVGKTFARALQDAGTEVRAFVEVNPRKIGQEIHGAPVLDTTGGLALRGVVHLAAVGQPGGRRQLRETLSGAGLRELADFVAVA
jgi:glycosyltransferase involved in cell wall biosynthesis